MRLVCVCASLLVSDRNETEGYPVWRSSSSNTTSSTEEDEEEEAFIGRDSGLASTKPSGTERTAGILLNKKQIAGCGPRTPFPHPAH